MRLLQLPSDAIRLLQLRRLRTLAESIGIVLCFGPGVVSADPAASINALVYSNALQEMQVLYSQAFSAAPSAERVRNFERFRVVLTNLASADLGIVQMTPTQSTLLGVARSVGTNSQRMDELLALYAEPTNAIVNRTIIPPPLRPEHVVEAYRPAWEALLLAPETDDMRTMTFSGTAASALGEIGNPASIPVLELAFAATCLPPTAARNSGAADVKQRHIVHELSQIPTAESLKAILRCVKLVQALPPTNRLKHPGKDVREAAIRSLATQRPEARKSWRQVLASFPKANLATNELQFLDQVESEQ